MIRFRYEGVDWQVSAGIKALGQQVEAAWPTRQPADGTVAGGSHVGWPTSDHGKDPNGWVRAIDVGQETDPLLDDLCEQLRAGQDPRIKYVINDRLMFSSYPARGFPPWVWRSYSGTNPHAGHAHISMNDSADNDGSPWAIDLQGESTMLTIVQLQQALVDAGYDLGTTGPNGDGVDGDYGSKSKAAHTAGLTALDAHTHAVPNHTHKGGKTGGVVR
jgi:hypothetical protein